MENGVINAGEVARPTGLVFLRAEGEGVYVDTSIGVAGVVLVGLDYIEVGSLTLREAVLAIELELGSYYRVLTPAVHVKSRLREDEGARIRDEGTELSLACNIVLVAKGKVVSGRGRVIGPASIRTTVNGTGELEEAGGVDETLRCSRDGGLIGSAEGSDGRRKSINGIRVVEGLGTECAEEDTSSI